MARDEFELPERDVWTVSRLNREVRLILETGLPPLWIEGEVSNLARPASGHLYFSLKDEAAQVRCVMWRSTALKLAVSPRNGQQLLLRARLSVYEPRGEYQLVVEYAEEAGEGALRRRFEALKAKLRDEGLFAEAAKRPLPRLPRRIGVVTSPSGAAVRDILHILKRRFPAVPVIIYPTPVQGDGAAAKIAAALATASRRAECDVLILARGGGSLEDLWSFNEEVVARAIRASEIPVVSGVGHEVDFTIADFAADLRAPTPSGAAEMVVPDALEWLRRLNKDSGRLRNAMQRQLGALAQKLDWQRRRLAATHPGNRLRQHQQRLGELEVRLRRAAESAIAIRQRRLAHAGAVLAAQSPARRVQAAQARVDGLQRRLHTTTRHQLQTLRARVETAGHALHTVSPLATLQRGYAIATDPRDGTILRDAGQLAVGDRLELRLARGRVEAEVTATRDDPTPETS
jgi:exodeoxyribonuclease VII large subunit